MNFHVTNSNVKLRSWLNFTDSKTRIRMIKKNTPRNSLGKNGKIKETRSIRSPCIVLCQNHHRHCISTPSMNSFHEMCGRHY